MYEPVAVIDIETTSLSVDLAKLRIFTGYSYLDNKMYFFTYKQTDEIKTFISRHKMFITFNGIKYDIPILENEGFEFKFTNYCKMIRDLYQLFGPKRDKRDNFFKYRLQNMGIVLKSYSLDSIHKALNLGEYHKLSFDYDILKKEDWTAEELNYIKEYAIRDVELTKDLYEYAERLHAPLIPLLSSDDIRKKIYLNTTAASLAYHILCHLADLDVEWSDGIKEDSYAGGHFVNPRFEKVGGHIAVLDIKSAYPNAIIQGNLMSSNSEGWKGDGYYNLKGCYRNDKLGNIEQGLKLIMEKSFEAKERGDKFATAALKIVRNSVYGSMGNPAFKHTYNITAAGDCTEIVATWIKKLAAQLESNGYIVLYGFTDSFYVKIPKAGSLEELNYIVNDFLETSKKHLPFPQDSFQIPLDGEFKFIWFVNKKKNSYIKVANDGSVKDTKTVMNSLTPKVVLKIYQEYIKPKIAKDLDVKFTMEELIEQLKMELENDPSYAANDMNIKDMSSYQNQTSLHYKLSKRYGSGNHKIITNIRGLGIPSSEGSKFYCKLEEFISAGYGAEDIYIAHLSRFFKKFCKPYDMEVLI